MGGFTDLGNMGVIFVESGEKNVGALLAPCWRRLGAWNCLRIDSYDDLLLPGHRLLAQLPVFASGEYFHCTNFQCCSTVVHRVTKHYNLQYSVQEMYSKLT